MDKKEKAKSMVALSLNLLEHPYISLLRTFPHEVCYQLTRLRQWRGR